MSKAKTFLATILSICMLAASASAHPVGGEIREVIRLKPKEQKNHQVFLTGNENTIVTASGSGTSKLFCQISTYVEGKLVVVESSATISNSCLFFIHPKQDDIYNLTVLNYDDNLNTSYLATFQ